MVKISRDKFRNKKPPVYSDGFLIILILTYCIDQSIPSSRDDDDNDVLLKNSVSLLKCVLQM